MCGWLHPQPGFQYQVCSGIYQCLGAAPPPQAGSLLLTAGVGAGCLSTKPPATHGDTLGRSGRAEKHKKGVEPPNPQLGKSNLSPPRSLGPGGCTHCLGAVSWVIWEHEVPVSPSRAAFWEQLLTFLSWGQVLCHLSCLCVWTCFSVPQCLAFGLCHTLCPGWTAVFGFVAV